MDLKQFRELYRYDPKADLLGQGGFGEVYRAYDVTLENEVALKFFTRAGAQKYTLIQEMQRAIKFVHPNICRYHSAYVLDGINEMGQPVQMQVGVMEFAQGGKIYQFLERYPQYRKKLLMDVLRGLSYLHNRKPAIIHRDLKPPNVLVAIEENEPIAKIADFGVSRTSQVTSGDVSVVGTFDYMAPEQIFPGRFGSPNLIPTNIDLWSFGVMAYELLTGSPPFGRDDPHASEGRIVEEIISGIPDYVLNQFPEPYKSVLKRCLVLHAAERAQKAEELIEILEGNSTAEVTGLIPVSWDGSSSASSAGASRGGTADLPGRWETQRLSVGERAATRLESASGEYGLKKPGETAELSRQSTERTKRKGIPVGGWVAAGLALTVVLAIGGWMSFGRKAVEPPPTPDPSLAITCNVACMWSLDGAPQGTLAQGEAGRVTVTAADHVVTAKPRDGNLKGDSKSFTATAGQESREDFVFGAPPPPSPKLEVTCNRPCTWTLDGVPRGSLLPGTIGNAALTAASHVVTAKSDDPAFKEESRSFAAVAGRSSREDFVFGGPTPPSPSPNAIAVILENAEIQRREGEAAAAIATCRRGLDSYPGSQQLKDEIQNIRDECGGQCPGVN